MLVYSDPWITPPSPDTTSWVMYVGLRERREMMFLISATGMSADIIHHRSTCFRVQRVKGQLTLRSIQTETVYTEGEQVVTESSELATDEVGLGGEAIESMCQ